MFGIVYAIDYFFLNRVIFPATGTPSQRTSNCEYESEIERAKNCAGVYKPIVYLYGENAYQAEEALSEDDLTCVHECFDMEDVLKTCLSPALLSKLTKERQRSPILSATSFDNLKNSDLPCGNSPFEFSFF